MNCNSENEINNPNIINIKNNECTVAREISDEKIRLFIEFLNNNFPNLCIRLLDVGARNGLSACGCFEHLRHFNNKKLYAVEPDVNEAERLIKKEEYYKVYTDALYKKRGTQKLYLTKTPGCSSILEPNIALLESLNLMFTDWFKVDSTIRVNTKRADNIFEEDTYDYIKVDTQGVEYEILSTMKKKTLENCICVHTESQTIPLYKNQKLLGDLLNLMYSRKFITLSMYTFAGNKDGLNIEYDIVFIKDPRNINSQELLLKQLLIGFLDRKSQYISYLLRTKSEYIEDKILLDRIYEILDEPKMPKYYRIKPIINI